MIRMRNESILIKPFEETQTSSGIIISDNGGDTLLSGVVEKMSEEYFDGEKTRPIEGLREGDRVWYRKNDYDLVRIDSNKYHVIKYNSIYMQEAAN